MENNILREAYEQMGESKSYKDTKTAISKTMKELTPTVAGNSAYSRDDQFGVEVDVITERSNSIPLAFVFGVIIRGELDRVDVVKIGSSEYEHIMKQYDISTRIQDIAETYYDMIK